LRTEQLWKEATTVIRTILIIFLLLLTTTAATASTATYSTSTGYVKIYDNAGKYQSYVYVPGLTDIVVYQGTHLYASSSSGIKIFDIHDASHPILMKHVSFACNSLAIKNSYLYAGGKELRVYSIASPLSPMVVGIKKLPGPCKVDGLEISGSILYVSTSAGVVKFPV
jgi:hypothetical protein